MQTGEGAIARAKEAVGAVFVVVLTGAFCVILAALGQTYELYRTMTQNLAFLDWETPQMIWPAFQFAFIALASVGLAIVFAAARGGHDAPEDAPGAPDWTVVALYVAPFAALILGLYGASAFISDVGAHRFAVIFEGTTVEETPWDALRPRSQDRGERFVDSSPYFYLGALGLLFAAIGAGLLWLASRSDIAGQLRRVSPHVRFFGALAAHLAMSLVVLLEPVAVPRALGPFVVLSLAVLLFAILFQAACELRVGRRFSLAFVLVLAAVIFSAAGLNNNHSVRTVEASKDAEAGRDGPLDLRTALGDWWRQRRGVALMKGPDGRFPIFIVVGQGGGIYSAAHLTHLLSAIDTECARFPHHLFATIGVSGGSVGTGLYRGAVEVLSQTRRRDPRVFAGADPFSWLDKQDCSVWPETYFVDSEIGDLFDQDFFSPIFAAFLFGDLLQRFIPYPVEAADRSRALERAFSDSWAAQVGAYAEFLVEQDIIAPTTATELGARVLGNPYGAFWAPKQDPLGFAAIFNTTDVRTGARQIISPFVFPSDDASFFPVWDAKCWAGDDSNKLYDSPSLITAALISARFPVITPTALTIAAKASDCSVSDVAAPPGERASLADGGYFENSGTSTALDLVRALTKEAQALGISDEISIHVIVTGVDAEPPTDLFHASELAGPVMALLSTRTARGFYEIKRLRAYFDAARASEDPADAMLGDFMIVRLDLREIPLPLGWQLAYGTQELILDQVSVDRPCDETGRAWREWVDAGRVGELPGVCARHAVAKRLSGSNAVQDASLKRR